MSQQVFEVDREGLRRLLVLLGVSPDTLDRVTLLCSAGLKGEIAVFCTIEDTVFGIGTNEYGQLGTEDTEAAAEVVRIEELCGRGMKGLAGGPEHCLGVTAAGQVYSWGWNSCGQLGRGTAARAAERPAVVPGLPEVVSVACGQYHSLALTAAGEVYAWGSNECGECGLQERVVSCPAEVYGRGCNEFAQYSLHEREVCRPVQVQLPQQATVTAVAAGLFHSAALTEDGKIFCWGANSCGQLGSGRVGGWRAEAREVAAPAGGFVQVACGYCHTLGLTGKGVVMAWGENGRGMLGVGKVPEEVGRPRAVRRLERATGILAAGDHSAAETAGGVYNWGIRTGGPSSGCVNPVRKAEEACLGCCLARSGPLSSLRVRQAASAAGAEM